MYKGGYTMICINEAHIGDILLYKMRLEDLPTNPAQIWYGCIKHILVEISDSSQPRYYIVQSLEHPDCEEWVYPQQVIGHEASQPT